MKKYLKILVSSVMVALTFSVLQMHSSQATEEIKIILYQPNGMDRSVHKR
ncbi:MAG: hypothetical protein K2Q34_04000 [Alphaproteobacteria bacterium]|nr:hypothetical protein [Alphaproteobacteria bacterium]